MKQDDLPRFSDLLAVCKLKVVPEAYACYEPTVINAILALAKDRLSRIQTTQELEWEPE